MGGSRKFKLSPRKNCLSPYHQRRAEERRLQRVTEGLQKLSLKDEHGSQELLNSSGSLPATSDSDSFKGFDVQPLKPGLRCISLFDGISTALQALDMMGLHVEAYFSSEIDENALKLQKHRFGDRIEQLGSVTDLTEQKLKSLGPIHLCIGGSPCSDLSLVNPRRRGLEDPASTGRLFYEYLRVKTILEDNAAAWGEPFFWLFENTFHMELSAREEISKCLGCHPVVKDAAQYLPVVRRRCFWGNLPGMDQTSLGAMPHHHLSDFLAAHRCAAVDIVPTLTTSSSSQKSGKQKLLPVIEDGKESPLFITEMEQLFGLPESFTDGPNLSITARRRLLGKCFCVPVIEDLLAPLKDLFWVRH